MFATPVYVPRNVLDPSLWASNRDSQARVDTISRLSIASSVASSNDLHRTSSTSSNHSSATSVSSTGSLSPTDRPRHRKTFSSNSIGVPRRLLKKPKPQGTRQRSDSAPTSSPYDTTVPSVPYIPTRPPPPPPPPRPAPPARQSLVPEPLNTKTLPKSRVAQPLLPEPTVIQSLLPKPLVVHPLVPKPLLTKPLPPRPQETQSEPCTPARPKAAVEWQCSDLVVRCKNDVYHVDRDVMCYHSRWFARICAIIKSPKSAKSVIDLGADDPDAVAAMMQYCYQLDYTTQLSGSDMAVPEESTLTSHVNVYMLAERYGIAGLKQIALQKFEELAGMVLMVDGNEEQLLQAIRALYAAERRADADDLKHAAIKLCANHVQAFIHGTGKTMVTVFESMDEFPDFRTDLFEEMASRWR